MSSARPRAKRKYSQHWLANDDLAVALVRLIEPRPEDRFLEIGPGQGRLTMALLRHPVSVTSVEVDPECCALLLERSGGAALRVVHADVLSVDPTTLGIEPPARAVGNLPYAISSPILRWTVDHSQLFADAHFTLALEVAERVLAEPGSPHRGLLSVIVQWEFEGEILRKLGPGAFRPPPKVDSAFVRLRRREPVPCIASRPHRERVVQAAFAHRRKTLANSLSHEGWGKEAVLRACETAGLDPGGRAEVLTLESFARLSEALPETRA